MARPSSEQMFDAEVIAELRRQFDAADKDASGEIDAEEACKLFARSCDEGATEDEIRKTAEALRHQVDTDRSGTISFDEYCFRFGRRYQMELNRRRRAGATSTSVPKQETLDEERQKLEREREAIRQERERLQLEREREALRKEREALERERQQASQGGSSTSGSSSGSTQALGPGTRVRIQGLRAAPELNGLGATVVRWEEVSGRFVVNVDEGRGQKSLKDANLVPLAAESAGLGQKVASMANSAVRHLQRGCAHVQVWVANSGYTWWQILLGVAVVVLVVSAWMQASSRYTSRRSQPSSFESSPQFSEERTYRPERRQESAFHRAPRYDDDDVGGYSGYDDSWSGGVDFGGTTKYLVIGGLVILCWKGIIPIHRMDWFQLYMLWNLIQSTGILGGRGGHYGGFGRRRRGFF